MKKFFSAAAMLLFCVLIVWFAVGRLSGEKEIPVSVKKKKEAPVKTEGKLYAGVSEKMSGIISQDEIASVISALTLEEPEVYTFLQGPRAWQEGFSWAGEWCQTGIKGNVFGGFGCGLCCMANIYDTLSPYECSPWDMCEYAMTASGYSPNGKAGAIGWGDMKTTLRAAGLNCDLYSKPGTYKAFQQQMKEFQSAVVLVCSANDDTYWKDTKGHYVNIWLYREDTDMVFLAEPGDPENNRSWIPLRYVYDALKTSSEYQYLAVDQYTEEKNQWKFTGIDEIWNRP